MLRLVVCSICSLFGVREGSIMARGVSIHLLILHETLGHRDGSGMALQDP